MAYSLGLRPEAKGIALLVWRSLVAEKAEEGPM